MKNLKLLYMLYVWDRAGGVLVRLHREEVELEIEEGGAGDDARRAVGRGVGGGLGGALGGALGGGRTLLHPPADAWPRAPFRPRPSSLA